jgi:hypothetical protein
MIKKLLVLLLIHNSLIYAQTIKTDVLVIGGAVSGEAAAIQSARSKVKTVLVEFHTGPGLPGGISVINTNSSLPSGIWGEFSTRVREFYRGKPGFDNDGNGPLKFEGTAAESILKKITDTVKNLTIYSNSQFISIKKDGDRWEVGVRQNEKTIILKARVVIDATEDGEIAKRLNGTMDGGIGYMNDRSKIYRTSIASLNNLSFIPLRAILLEGADNVFITEKALPVKKDVQFLPAQFQIGQGAGAAAAYCAFFKTTTKNLKVRIIQGEILDFKGGLLPFSDISQQDHDWRTIEQVGLTGMLKGRSPKGRPAQFLFRPDSAVATAEVKPVLTEIYTRAFLWFNREKPGEKFTVGNMLSLISDYTLTEPEVLKANMQKAWKNQYKFTLDFNPMRTITRREFAVLVNKYLNPFARTVDLDGRLIN